ncbi:MAG TPA: response regulator [Blastocatellia bacterium]|nr:response regulator [Blastocatellia bacterium]
MPEFDAILDGLRSQFLHTARERFERLEQTLDALEQLPPESAGAADALGELMRQFHSLSGSGSTFGFPGVSALGRQAEEECLTLLGENKVPTRDDLARWRLSLADLKRELFDNQNYEPPSAIPDSSSAGEESAGNLSSAADFISPPPFSYVLVAVSDEALCRELTDLFGHEGATVLGVGRRAEAWHALESHLPAGIVLEMTLPDGRGTELTEQIRHLPGGGSPVILMIGEHAGLLDKVEAIRSGADGWFDKPVDGATVARRLKYLLESRRPAPGRVMSVEDDPEQAAFIKAVLEAAGYEVRLCTDLAHFEDDLVAFDPDLILMDVLLPGVSGYALSSYLRQDERHAALPIIFLTTQDQTHAQIESLRAGGDDHLTKPIHAELLLAGVASRIARARLLKSLINRHGES